MIVISNQSNVYVRVKSLQATLSLNGSAECFITSTSERGTHEEDVTCLTDVGGTVHRLFSVYGFISIKHPILAAFTVICTMFTNPLVYGPG